MPAAFCRTSSDLATDPISLTLAHVSAVPKRNNEQYIAVYIRSQSALLRQWALDGAKEAASWDIPAADKENNPTLKATEGVFSSPVLKPRVPEKKDVTTERLAASQQTKSRNALADTTRNIQATAKQKDSKLYVPNATKLDKPRHKDACDTAKKSRTHTKKIAAAAHSGSEVEKRLAERRERKKRKRNIVAPEVSDNESQVEAKKGKKARKTSAKTPTGFALMHGFSATNVGRNRLTLDRILENTGVFGKGRASSAAKIVENGKTGVFSESDFLKKGSRTAAKTKARQRSASPSLSDTSSSSSSSSASSSPSSSIRRKRKTEKRQKKRRRPRSPEAPVGESRPSSVSKTTPAQQNRPTYDPANSIVWDIEKESHLSASASKFGTILVKVPHTLGRERANPQSGAVKDHPSHAGGTENLRNALVDHADDLVAHVPPDRLSILSLGPSESASQLGKASARRPQPVISATSKYFRPANVPTGPSPVEDLLGESSFIYAPKNEGLVAPQQTVTPPDNLDAFRSLLQPTEEDLARDPELDWDEPMASDPDVAPLRNSSDEPCFWSQVAYDFDPRGQSPIFDDSLSAPDVYPVDDYAVSSDLPLFLEPDTYLHDLGSSAFMEDEPSFDSNHYGDFQLGDPLLTHSMDVAYEEDYTICHDQDMEHIPSTQTSGWTESSTLPAMDEYYLPNMILEQDLPEDDAEEERSVVAGAASSDLSTGAALVVFQQGRGLLRGFGGLSGDKVAHSISKTEAEVAGNLRRNHWLPQRF